MLELAVCRANMEGNGIRLRNGRTIMEENAKREIRGNCGKVSNAIIPLVVSFLDGLPQDQEPIGAPLNIQAEQKNRLARHETSKRSSSINGMFSFRKHVALSCCADASSELTLKQKTV
jgi:hypothetical protein